MGGAALAAGHRHTPKHRASIAHVHFTAHCEYDVRILFFTQSFPFSPALAVAQRPAFGATSIPACWERRRDARNSLQSAAAYFDATLIGASCSTNWYEVRSGSSLRAPSHLAIHSAVACGMRVQGNDGDLGWGPPPTFSKVPAPALLGFDESIDWYCNMHNSGGRYYGHAGNCVNAGLNILSLYVRTHFDSRWCGVGERWVVRVLESCLTCGPQSPPCAIDLILTCN